MAQFRFTLLLLVLAVLPFALWPGTLGLVLPAALGVTVPACEPNRMLTLRCPPLRGDDVAELQATLSRLDFYDGPVDGVFSAATARAVSSLRAKHGLSSSPRTDSAFWRVLEDEWWDQKPEGSAFPVSWSAAPEGELLIVVDIERLRLTLYVDGYPFKSYPVAVGKPSTPSAVGQWEIASKGINVGPPFGTRWMGLSVPWGIYGIHGTNNPGSIGTAASGGCIRMFNWNVEELYKWVPIGTPVWIVSPHWTASVPPGLPKGSVGLSVVFLQWQMQRLGFKPGGADGRFGEATANAIRDIEAFYGLEVDGVADTDVLCLLDLDR